ILCICSRLRSATQSALFPYPTLFRSQQQQQQQAGGRRGFANIMTQASQQQSDEAYAPTYFPGTISPESATPVSGLMVPGKYVGRSEEHTSELQSLRQLVCRRLLEKKQ